MTDREMIANTIDRYMDLQRIEVAEDRDKEILNQKTNLSAQLEAFGIVVENLKIVK